MLNGEKPSYKTLRLNTLTKTGAEFNPKSIHRWLITDRASEITFLGVIHIEEMRKILRDAESILLLIKQKLMDADHQETFHVPELARVLSLDENYAKIIFAMVCEFGNVFNSASSDSSKGKHSFNTFTINNDETFDAYLSFTSLEQRMIKHFERQSEYEGTTPIDYKLIGNRDLLLDHNGELQFTSYNSGIFGHLSSNGKVFISPSRIKELMNIESRNYDFLKLLHLCKEINCNYLYGNLYSVALLTRALIDHVPPIFEMKSFNQVASNYKSEKNTQSFKKAMIHLDNSLRNVGDSSIHSQIRKSEVLPNDVQVDFKSDLDVLLGEIVRILKF